MFMVRVDLKYQFWSESIKEGLVFEDQTWRIQGKKWPKNEERLNKIGSCYRFLAQIGVWLKFI